MSYQAEVLADSPIGYWPLNEAAGAASANDLGSLSLDGTPVGADGGPIFGVAGGLADGSTAARFNGVDDLIVITGSAASYELNAGAFTIEMWVREVTSSGAFPGLIWKYHGSTTGWDVFYNGTTKAAVFKRGNVDYASPAGAVTSGGFTHLVCVYTGTKLRWYVNGDLVSEATVTFANTTDATHDMELGSGDSVQGNVEMQHVAIYNTALSLEDVQRHYAAGEGGAAHLDVQGVASDAQVGALFFPTVELLVSGIAVEDVVGSVAFPPELAVSGVEGAGEVAEVDLFELALNVRSRKTVRLPRR